MIDRMKSDTLEKSELNNPDACKILLLLVTSKYLLTNKCSVG